jgi:sugar phosphate isomerase/epimerase
VKISQVAAILYTVRDQIKTSADVAVAFRKIRAIGYQAVQFQNLPEMSDAEVMRLLDGEGLVCCATHESPDQILNDPAGIAERLHRLGCRHTAYPYPATSLETLGDVQSLIRRLEASGKIMNEAGSVLTYHNHHVEFRRFDGQLMLDLLYRQADPRFLQAELDTYWVQYGGGNPVEWIRRLSGRLPLLHLKDYMITADNKPDFAEVGSGNLSWPAIIAAADAAGCEWYIVEQDRCPGDPFDSLRKSFEFLKTMASA